MPGTPPEPLTTGPADGPPAASVPPPPPSLTHGLRQRHLSMIALGGVIGAGLFVGSGAGIAAAGPSIVLAYAASGLLVWSFIAASQLRTRRRLEREAPERLVVRMWLFPGLTWASQAAVAAVLLLLLMLREGDTRVQLACTAGLTLALAAAGLPRQRAHRDR